MADYLGSINTLPYAKPPQNDGRQSIVPKGATDKCILSQAPIDTMIPQPKKNAFQEFFSLLNNLPSQIKKTPETIINMPETIEKTAKKADEKAQELLDKKLTSLINPNPQPTPKFPIKVKDLSPKMKLALLKLYYYAKQEGISFTINDGFRTEEEQAELQKTSKYAARCSAHVQKMAVDVHIEGKSIGEAQADLKKLGTYWKKLTGGRWGGDWYGKDHEPWHFDLKRANQNLCLTKIITPKTSEGA